MYPNAKDVENAIRRMVATKEWKKWKVEEEKKRIKKMPSHFAFIHIYPFYVASKKYGEEK